MSKGLFVFFTLLMLAISPVFAMETVTLAAVELHPYIDKTKTNGGFLGEIVKRSFDFQLIKTDYKFIPLKLAPAKMKEESFQALIPFIRPDDPNSKENAAFLYSDSILRVNSQVFARNENVAQSSPTFWKGKSLCRPVGYPMEGLNEIITKYKWELVRPANIQTCVRLLQQKKVDLVAMSDNFAAFILKEVLGTLDGYQAVPGMSSGLDFTLRVERADPKAMALLAAFNRGLAQLKATPDYKQILKTNGF